MQLETRPSRPLRTPRTPFCLHRTLMVHFGGHLFPPDTIYVTRSELTRRFCLHTGRRGAMTTDDLYLQIIPELERQGEAIQVLKRGKFEVYAFRTEFSP